MHAHEPDPYDPTRRALAATPFAQIRYVAQTGSSNEDMAALLGTPDIAGTSIVAGSQTRGSGRRGRPWLAAPGRALTFTTALPRQLASAHLWAATFWSALAVEQGLLACGVAATLQWPNDLLLHGRKLAGILCISRVIGEQAWVACGVGINLRYDPHLMAALSPPPAFCDEATSVASPQLLEAILLAFDATLPLLAEPAEIAQRWSTRAGLPGCAYRILRDGETTPFDATAIALEDGGALRVARTNGSEESVALADARALR